MNERYSVTLADGTRLDNLRLNGNNFISDTPVDAATFDGNCSPVVIQGPEEEFGLVGTHPDMELVQVVEQVSGEWWFVLRDLSPTELRERQTKADLDFLAAMMGVSL